MMMHTYFGNLVVNHVFPGENKVTHAAEEPCTYCEHDGCSKGHDDCFLCTPKMCGCDHDIFCSCTHESGK